MAWVSPRTWVTGEIVTAAEMNTEIRDQFTNITQAYTNYTPVLANITSSATVTGKWAQFGKTYFVEVNINITATVTGGGTPITCTMPNSLTAANIIATRKPAVEYRNNAGVHVLGVVQLAGGSNTFQVLVEAPSGANPNLGNWTSANPGTQVSGDNWAIAFNLEAA